MLPECETPTTKEEFEALSKKVLDEVLILEKGGTEDGWREVDVAVPGAENLNIHLYEKPDEKTGIATLKTTAIFPFSPRVFI